MTTTREERGDNKRRAGEEDDPTLVLLAKRSLQKAQQHNQRQKTSLVLTKKSLDGERREFLRRCQLEKNLFEKKMARMGIGGLKSYAGTRDSDSEKSHDAGGCDGLLRSLRTCFSSYFLKGERDNKSKGGMIQHEKSSLLGRADANQSKELTVKKGRGVYPKVSSTKMTPVLVQSHTDVNPIRNKLHGVHHQLNTPNSTTQRRRQKISLPSEEEKPKVSLPKIVVTPPSDSGETSKSLRRRRRGTGRNIIVIQSPVRWRPQDSSPELEKLVNRGRREKAFMSVKENALKNTSSEARSIKTEGNTRLITRRAEPTNSQEILDKKRSKSARTVRFTSRASASASDLRLVVPDKNIRSRPLVMNRSLEDFHRNQQILDVLGIVHVKANKEPRMMMRIRSAPPSMRIECPFRRR